MPIPAPLRTTMPASVVVMCLTLLLGIQPVTTDLYLPALPTLARDLGAPIASAQLTLSTLIICFGLGQLLCGPLADRYGRKPVLRGGLALYVATSLLGALAPSIGWLIAWRALQGLGMAAAVTCGRSIIRDLYAPIDGARVMSRALSGLGVIALASPLIGGLIVTFAHWRAALFALALFGAASLAYLAGRFQESLPAPNLQATHLGPMLHNWRVVLRHPTFRAFALLSSGTYGGLYTMLAASSFVFIQVLGTSRVGYGLLMSSVSLAYIVGTLLCRRLLARHGLRYAVAVGGGLSLAGGVSMAALSLIVAPQGPAAVWAIVVPMWLYALGHGIHQPCGQAGAVGPFPDKAGTAASLSGFFMMLTAFAWGLLLGRLLDAGSVYPLSFGVCGFSVVIAVAAWTQVQRHGEVARGSPIAADPPPVRAA